MEMPIYCFRQMEDYLLRKEETREQGRAEREAPIARTKGPNREQGQRRGWAGEAIVVVILVGMMYVVVFACCPVLALLGIAI
ncbi:MAG: hypothetical protein LBL86_11300 [Coriobacteriales bacterium]|jgi:hypothetical protein|nr:hypothetical protein [Coriobacteriales bacterium]